MWRATLQNRRDSLAKSRPVAFLRGNSHLISYNLFFPCSWRAHTRQQVEFQDLVAVIRRVRREVEGPVGGADYQYYGGGGGGEGLARPSGVRHALLLRYIINPPDGELLEHFRGVRFCA